VQISLVAHRKRPKLKWTAPRSIAVPISASSAIGGTSHLVYGGRMRCWLSMSRRNGTWIKVYNQSAASGYELPLVAS
jgi:hypothetical protein